MERFAKKIYSREGDEHYRFTRNCDACLKTHSKLNKEYAKRANGAAVNIRSIWGKPETIGEAIKTVTAVVALTEINGWNMSELDAAFSVAMENHNAKIRR